MRLIFLFLFCCHSLSAAYIGYAKSGGRFGDNLLTYLHAKWLSYKRGIPVLYDPFEYSSELVLDAKEARLTYPHPTIPLRPGLRLDPKLPLIYLCPYFPAFEEEQKEGGWKEAFPVDWKDPEFRRQALEMIAPKSPLALITPPADVIRVALHVREGGGFDTDHTRLYDPLKLPPLSFYADALTQILHQFPKEKIYCYIFTDAIDPKSIAKKISKSISENLVFHYRKEGNHHTKNVLEDFFSLFQFDILVRPRSNFSIVPSLLQDYALVYFPAEYVRLGKTIQITRIGTEQNEALCAQLLCPSGSRRNVGGDRRSGEEKGSLDGGTSVRLAN